VDFELTRPAVSLTDFALAIECAAFALLLARLTASDGLLRKWFVVFFASIAAASVLGGTMHGFFEYSTSPVRTVLWTATLLSILVTSFATWTIAAILQLRPPAFTMGAAVRARPGSRSHARDSLRERCVPDRNRRVPAGHGFPSGLILDDLPPPGQFRARWGIVGLVLTFLGAAVQQLKLAVHPVYFDHNALYHLIQFVALWMIYRAATWISIAQPIVRRAS